ncbi:hypothetical protein [Alkalihalobacillus pseudalcaliphilus]|uniref:hypothetical protein n=1 Tax=Alkalihalobacillus pseudalcaliphilus TaxID=79884 RepID=UPI000AD2A9BA|nr:hypothetical protein [Alkalihalobacillus pseudalcaliphilus]
MFIDIIIFVLIAFAIVGSLAAWQNTQIMLQEIRDLKEYLENDRGNIPLSRKEFEN